VGAGLAPPARGPRGDAGPGRGRLVPADAGRVQQRPARRRLGRRGGRQLCAARFVGADPSLAALAQPQRPTPPNAFDPLAAELESLKGQVRAAHPAQPKALTLPFGADKWGHDIVKKTIKGGETSIVVGLVAAFVAVALGTLFGAISGFFGGVVDDVFNWFYSIFTSIPSILMILTVAAVLQQKGVRPSC
jgi:ABC-type dipeptide/oligopeptide/nickel transport system permease subunit